MNQEFSRFLKTASQPSGRYYEFDNFRIDLVKSLLYRGGTPVPLPPKAFEVLAALVRRNGAIVTKDELLSGIWRGAFVEESNLTQYIYLLRKALGEASAGSRYIVTLPKIGYRFAAEVRPRSELRPDEGSVTAAQDAKAIAILPFEALDDDARTMGYGEALSQALTARIIRLPG